MYLIQLWRLNISDYLYSLNDHKPLAIVKYLPAATKLGQGNIFTSVYQEFCPQGGSASVHAGIHHPPPTRTRHTPLGVDPPDQAHHPPPEEQTPPIPATPPGADTPPEADCSMRSTSGRYASYWNAFLYLIINSFFCVEI